MDGIHFDAPSSASATLDSERKLNAAAEGLAPCLVNDVGRSCIPRIVPAVVEELKGYRCRCSYQVLVIDSPVLGDASANTTKIPRLQYAVRKNHQPVPVRATSDVRIANRRIQQAMSGLMTILNRRDGGGGGGTTSSMDDEASNVLRTNLTSVTFSTSWDERDCTLSMNYSPTISDPEVWKQRAESARLQLNVVQISGRSKKLHLRAEGSMAPICLADTLVLTRDASAHPHSSLGSSWDVRILDTEHSPPSGDISRSGDSSEAAPLLVHYEKPESAFYHPNPFVMCRALSWILHRLDVCCSVAASPSRPQDRLRLLELYCGCGAHSMAILQSRLPMGCVVAVEYDERLTRALRRNCQLNGLPCDVGSDACLSGESENDRNAQTGLTVVTQDAGRYVKRLLRQQHSGHSTHETFDVMLVDPPKLGLDAAVCDFACSHPTLQHVLYVSCGRDALLRDLKRLRGCFQVVDCVLLDLFPGTSAVETLVHLQRHVEPA